MQQRFDRGTTKRPKLSGRHRAIIQALYSAPDPPAKTLSGAACNVNVKSTRQQVQCSLPAQAPPARRSCSSEQMPPQLYAGICQRSCQQRAALSCHSLLLANMYWARASVSARLGSLYLTASDCKHFTLVLRCLRLFCACSPGTSLRKQPPWRALLRCRCLQRKLARQTMAICGGRSAPD